jgi:hypothetical protein
MIEEEYCAFRQRSTGKGTVDPTMQDHTMKAPTTNAREGDKIYQDAASNLPEANANPEVSCGGVYVQNTK